jgi:microsomal dipeptidase-like Zn-dependent dipeptidase
MNFYGAAPKSVSGQQLPQILTHSNERFLFSQKRNKKDKERLL